MNIKTELFTVFALFWVVVSLPSVSRALEQDDEVPALLFATAGVESIYHDGTRVSETILRHVRAFVSTDSVAVAEDYGKRSTLTFGPGGESMGATNDIVGNEDIQAAFESFFTGGLFPPGTVLTITSAGRIGSQFYQTFDYATEDADCTGSDTFVVRGRAIRRQTAYIICTQR